MPESVLDQRETLRYYTRLSTLQPSWAGSLILSCGLGPDGANFTLAANIVGAACLSIDASPENCRSALRSGAVDFAVNSLDEALRALKNEIRKRHPLSVALQGDPAVLLPEALERGLFPILFAAFTAHNSTKSPQLTPLIAIENAAKALAAMGTLVPDFHAEPTEQASVEAEQIFTLVELSLSSPSVLRALDQRLANLIPPEDPRRRWTLAAPRIFHRKPFKRLALLTDQEQQALA